MLGVRASLRSRLVALVLFAVLLLLAASALAVHVGTRALVDRVAGAELKTAERVWDRFLELRGRRLLSAVSVLAEDFGFREAVASGDRATGLSALLNHAGRVDADLAVLLSPDGAMLMSLPDLTTDRLDGALKTLVRQAESGGGAVSLIEIEGIIVQLALVPVRAPQRVAWAGFGFALEGEVLRDFKDLTGADLSLVDAQTDRLLATSREGVEPALDLQQHARGRGLDRFVELRSSLPTANGARMQRVLQFERERFEAPMRDLRWNILRLSLLMALPALLGALWAARGIARPLRELTTTVGRIAGGDYSTPIPPASGEELERLSQAVDLMQTQIREREGRIHRQAIEDALTGLPNRNAGLAFLDALEGVEGGGIWHLLLLDVRRFAQFNDRLGTSVGDSLLVAISQRLREGCVLARLARLGANEFMVLCDVSPDAVDDARWASQLLDRLSEPFMLDGVPFRIEFCAGLARLPHDASDARALLRRAQLALLDAKREGAALSPYRRGSEDQHLRELRLMSDLRFAAERGEFSLVFQPKIDLQLGKVVHAEALLRWSHVELGSIYPDEFIPIAERGGLIGELTGFAIHEAVAAALCWRSDGLDCCVAVNLSALDLSDPGLAGRILSALESGGLAPSSFLVEVTESAIIGDLVNAVAQLQALRAAGVRVAIDDFGTGQSSLAQLQRLPADELKIDKAFVLDLHAGSDEVELVRIAVELGHRLGMTVVAEGVETAQGLAVLRSLGCDLGQGYLFSRPLSRMDFRAWCASFEAAWPVISRSEPRQEAVPEVPP